MKKILALLLSLMLVLSLAACGGDDTTDTAVDEEPVVTDEAETPAEDEEVPEGRITDEQLAEYVGAIIASQSADVDIISGATVDCQAIGTAIGQAFAK